MEQKANSIKGFIYNLDQKEVWSQSHVIQLYAVYSDQGNHAKNLVRMHNCLYLQEELVKEINGLDSQLELVDSERTNLRNLLDDVRKVEFI